MAVLLISRGISLIDCLKEELINSKTKTFQYHQGTAKLKVKAATSTDLKIHRLCQRVWVGEYVCHVGIFI